MGLLLKSPGAIAVPLDKVKVTETSVSDPFVLVKTTGLLAVPFSLTE